MVKISSTILLCVVLSSSYCHAIDYDKKLHIGASALSGVVVTAFIQSIMPEASGTRKFVYASALAMIPGIAKELHDSRSGGSGWDNKDLFADLAGASFGTATVLTVTWQW